MPPAKMNKRIKIPERMRSFVTLRDCGICQNCGLKGKIQHGFSGRAYAYTSYKQGNKEKRISFDISHIVPVCKGGLNVAENLVLMCRECNRSMKGEIWQEKE